MIRAEADLPVGFGAAAAGSLEKIARAGNALKTVFDPPPKGLSSHVQAIL